MNSRSWNLPVIAFSYCIGALGLICHALTDREQYPSSPDSTQYLFDAARIYR
jgi:hypothetical protein